MKKGLVRESNNPFSLLRKEKKDPWKGKASHTYPFDPKAFLPLVPLIQPPEVLQLECLCFANLFTTRPVGNSTVELQFPREICFHERSDIGKFFTGVAVPFKCLSYGLKALQTFNYCVIHPRVAGNELSIRRQLIKIQVVRQVSINTGVGVLLLYGLSF